MALAVPNFACVTTPSGAEVGLDMHAEGESAKRTPGAKATAPTGDFGTTQVVPLRGYAAERSLRCLKEIIFTKVDNTHMPQIQDKRLNATAIAALCLALLPIAVFYVLLWHSMRNVPIIDDYHAIMEFALTLKQLPTLGQKLLWIVAAQHNDYKLILLHLIVAAQIALTGHISFSFLIATGNLLVLGILWLFWKHSFTGTSSLTSDIGLARRIVLFVPVSFLVMQLNWVENLDWALNDIQTIGVLFFSLACLHCLLREGRSSFALACVCAALSCFSSVNGFLLAPIGLLVLVPRRKWAQIAIWFATFALSLSMYLYHYVPFGVTKQLDGAPLWDKFVFLLSLLGAAVENMSRFPVKGAAIVLGVVMLTLVFIAARARYDRTNPFAAYTVLWVLLTCMLIAKGRSGFGITLSLMGRYKIYSDMLMVFCYVFAASSLQKASVAAVGKRVLYAAVLAFSALQCLGSDYFGYKFLLNRQRRVAAGINQYEADPSKNVPMVSLTDQPIPQEEPEHDRLILTRALQSGIYKLPPIAQR
jgi:hypothetical protein